MLPNKSFNMPIPRSQLNGGSNLDEGCGDIGQAEAGTGLDSVTKQLAQDTTEFTRQTTSHPGSPENGRPGLPLMSTEGKKLASKSAPSSAYKTTTIGTSAVDKAMRGRS